MCGIIGFLAPVGRYNEEALGPMALAMAQTLEHRGPDGFGVWSDAEAVVALAHRRLSIQDLSAAGTQPMASACGRYVITYNGELYNFGELRHELAARGHGFRGHCDTEVVLAAVREWGLTRALERFQGMFAFGLWDRERRELSLVRDRVGKKPLYYGWCGGSFLFASELKALRPHPDFDPEIDHDALGLLIQYSFIPTPYSIFRSIRKLPPGTVLTVPLADAHQEGQPRSYWSARQVAERGEHQPFPGDMDAAIEALDALLRDAVQGRMVADVDLGALLSGGIDSTTVVALMQTLSPRPVKTFTIGFQEPEFNEAEHAKAIARHLGTEHTELTVTARETLEMIPQLPTLYDEPLADASAIPTFIVSRLARSRVTVALSGDGGDELFGGYTRYLSTLRQWDRCKRYPLVLRRLSAGALGRAARLGWQWSTEAGAKGQDRPWARRPVGAKLEKRSRRLGAADPVDLFTRISSYWDDPGEVVLGAKPVPSVLSDLGLRAAVSQPLQAMMYLDFMGFMLDDILVKVDRASMAVGLEIRSPLLDHRIVELAWSLPLGLRIGPGGGKYVLRALLERYVPRALTERPKQGFNVPVAEWLRGPLRPWAEALLDPQRIDAEGLLDPEVVTRLWHQHLSGWGNRKNVLWSILMFQAWHEAWSSPAAGQAEATPVPAIA
jgi:asparagine synthase (glutamine-hydrolysing)